MFTAFRAKGFIMVWRGTKQYVNGKVLLLIANQVLIQGHIMP
jgi:hypothetical protein